MQRLFAILISILPHHFISRGLFFLSRIQAPWLQKLLIRFYSRAFDIDLGAAVLQDLSQYKTLNQFFTRELKPEARVIDQSNDGFVSPVDGRVSQCGEIDSRLILQAKGREYSVAALLGESYDPVFDHGAFATLYLSPKDYHRIHMPIDGTLLEMTYIPGRLFSVAPFCVNNIDSVFARNERVVCIFSTSAGKIALVLVGAINVAAIETVWAGLVTPKKGLQKFAIQYANEIALEKGQEMGRFNMGSTVILITENGRVNWLEEFTHSGTKVLMGQKIANLDKH